MMKTRLENDVTDYTGVCNVENDTGLSWMIGPSEVYDKN